METVHILLVGDFMLDVYTSGKVQRISPEAPVPVLRVSSQRHLPGGAGNVALNFKQLGARVSILGRFGADEAGEMLLKSFKENEIDTSLCFQDEEFTTPIKNRLIAGSQQMIRLDQEKTDFLCDDKISPLEKKLASKISEFHVIAISDYGKGMITSEFTQRIIRLAKRYQIPVIVDPKGVDFSKYAGATMIKPNLKEAYEAAHLPLTSELDAVADVIMGQVQMEYLMITRSENGISLFDSKQTHYHASVEVKEVVDVTGAGDTVLAMASLGLAYRIPMKELLELCNIAAGIAVEKLGCAKISLKDVAQRLLTKKDHSFLNHSKDLAMLNLMLHHSSIMKVFVHDPAELTFAFVKELSKLKKNAKEDFVLLCLQFECKDRETLELLSNLVDFILQLDLESIQEIHSSRSFVWKAQKMDQQELLEV